MKSRTSSWRVWGTFVALVSAGLAGFVAPGCEGKIGARSGGESADVGQIQLALTLPGGVAVTSVGWELRSGSNATLAAGTVNVENPSARLAVDVGAPPGAGDTFRMTATTSRGESCSGVSAPFDVLAGRVVTVEVSLFCSNLPAPDGGLGLLVIKGVLVPGDSCPVLTSWVVSPTATAAAGGTIDVTAGATDAEGEALTFAWTATAGSFTDPGASSTRYVCGPAGDQSLTVTISDNHQPAACFISVTFPAVTCLADGGTD